MKLLKLKLVLPIVLALTLSLIVSEVRSQAVNIVGREADFKIIYDDTLSIAATNVLLPNPGHSGWHRISDFQFFSGWVTFTDPGSISLTTADTVEISMEQYSNTVGPTSASTGFYEVTAAGGTPTREVLATYDINLIQFANPTFFSFHGSGDPEIAPGSYVRFYVRVVSGFTGAGLGFKFGFFKQP